jgi:hypothetical protein
MCSMTNSFGYAANVGDDQHMCIWSQILQNFDMKGRYCGNAAISHQNDYTYAFHTPTRPISHFMITS